MLTKFRYNSFQVLVTAFVSFAFLLAATTGQAQRSTLTRHVPDAVASGLAPMVGHVAPDERLSLALSLPLRNQAELSDLLQRLYDPRSASYHKYLSVQEFAARFGATQADYDALVQFAQAHGLTVVDKHANRMVLDLEASAATIENAFHVKLGIFQHPTEARTFYAPDREPTLDSHLRLLHISGLDDFSLPRPKYIESNATSRPEGSGPDGSYLGSDLRAAYYGSGPLNGAGQSVGLFELAGYDITDINHYFNSIKQPRNVPIVGVSVNHASLACAPPCNDSEQSLDIEQAISIAPGLSQLEVYVGKTNVSVFSAMASRDTSKTLSCSWGWADNETSLDPIFEEMAAQGQTVFVATGDQGSSTPPNVVWPSDDPWVTAVGGTVLITNGPGGPWESETGWTKSAGMPSPNNVPIPTYQMLAGVVNASNGASSTLRNIPDIASESDAVQYACYVGVCKERGGGTSYAAPLWASLIAMANQQSLANGGTYIGFLNPTLYAIGTGSDFTSDIYDSTSGSNGAYSAVVGYDLVTGWGSPNGPGLIDTLAPQ
jgi:subtilase family serine protease